MSIVKRGSCSSKATISSTVLVCSSCGHTEMAKKSSGKKKCPECQGNMVIVSSDNNIESSDDNTSDTV